VIVVPAECDQLLRLQRTELAGLTQPEAAAQYAEDLVATFETFRAHLPNRAERILDVGAGLAGIDVLLARHYDHEPEITLLDRQGITPGPQGGFHHSGFAGYNDFGAALELLEANGVHGVRTCNVNVDPYPFGPFDVVISLLSWGFHYPVDTYFFPTKVMVLDVRKGTTGLQDVSAYGHVEIVHRGHKHLRVVVTC
jgi:hypothetical protein